MTLFKDATHQNKILAVARDFACVVLLLITESRDPAQYNFFSNDFDLYGLVDLILTYWASTSWSLPFDFASYDSPLECSPKYSRILTLAWNLDEKKSVFIQGIISIPNFIKIRLVVPEISGEKHHTLSEWVINFRMYSIYVIWID